MVASRLSEDEAATVVLLEAGGSDLRPDVLVPGASGLLHRSSADWRYYTEPQARMFGRRLYYPRGKVVGGSGSTNTLVYMRGHALDFDGWAAEGATGWAFRDVLPYFKRAENYLVPGFDRALQGEGGPLDVDRPRYEHPLARAFVEAGVSCGLPARDDFNRGDMEGVGAYHFNVSRGVRRSTARAYLAAATRRKNLTLVTKGHVERLVFEGLRCVGVQVRRGRALETLRAKREVILSAGAVNTPKILMLSGIGPGPHLQDRGISVLVDQPNVGAHLQDHPLMPMADRGGEETANSTLGKLGPIVRYLATRGGPLSTPIPVCGGFARTCHDDPRPDIQFHFAAGWANDMYHFAALPPEDGYTICVTVSRPVSRGRVTLATPHPEDPPCIDPGFFTDEVDLATMTRGFRLAQRILASRAFEPHRKGPARPPRRLEDDGEIHDFIRRATETNYHPVSSCRMGQEAISVVTPDLRVRGVESLRVIDASVMPAVTTGNTNAPTVMIAERGAELVRHFSKQ